MHLTLFTCTLAILISSIVFLASWILASRSSQDREKLSPFECGFDPKSSARVPFSLRFFLLAVIFLVFDIEIVLLLPAPLMNPNFISTPPLVGMTLFILILMLGLMHEWNEGSLDWMN